MHSLARSIDRFDIRLCALWCCAVAVRCRTTLNEMIFTPWHIRVCHPLEPVASHFHFPSFHFDHITNFCIFHILWKSITIFLFGSTWTEREITVVFCTAHGCRRHRYCCCSSIALNRVKSLFLQQKYVEKTPFSLALYLYLRNGFQFRD